MRFAILGPGGVGGLLAALLAQSGDEVEVLAGDSTVREIATNGMRVESRRFGDFNVNVGAATALTSPVDAILVTVKATQLEEAVKRAPASALGDGLVIPFLNGIDHVETLRRIYLPQQVVAATIRIETARVAPGVIRHTSPFAAVALARGGPVAEHLRATGLDVSVALDEKAILWDKFALLAPMALLTTAARANVGVIRTQRREELVALIGEVTRIAGADGVVIDPSAILRLIDSIPDTMETSMQRDQAAGRPLELDALGGALIRRAAKAGVDATVITRLVDEISTSA